MEQAFTLISIKDVAHDFWQQVGDATVFAFHGEMGAGKTSFIHALCAAKGVKDAVGSPTFSIINEYAFEENGLDRRIYHMDLYRLKSEDEAVQAGVEDCFYSGGVCLVEWPEKAPGIFPPETVEVFITILDSDTRKIRIGGK